jgi:unsaturated chondroitin disaccharide hydrolase
MLFNLSKNYRGEAGADNNFILNHCVGSFPHNEELDIPLVYADYYYLEALLRYKKMG